MRVGLILSAGFVAAAVCFAQKMTDQQFVNAAAEGNMTESRLGQIAQTKGTTPRVKDYGKMLEQDHDAANKMLKSAAGGLKVPESIDAEHQAEIDKLDKFTGTLFDYHFQQAMIQDHKEAIEEFKTASTELKSQSLRKYASETLPTLEKHQTLAGELSWATTFTRPTPGSTNR